MIHLHTNLHGKQFNNNEMICILKDFKRRWHKSLFQEIYMSIEICSFMNCKGKWNRKESVQSGASMCIHEIQQLLLLDLGPAFSHWVTTSISITTSITSSSSKVETITLEKAHRKLDHVTKNLRSLEFLMGPNFNSWKRKNFGIRIFYCDSLSFQPQIEALILMRRFS